MALFVGLFIGLGCFILAMYRADAPGQELASAMDLVNDTAPWVVPTLAIMVGLKQVLDTSEDWDRLPAAWLTAGTWLRRCYLAVGLGYAVAASALLAPTVLAGVAAVVLVVLGITKSMIWVWEKRSGTRIFATIGAWIALIVGIFVLFSWLEERSSDAPDPTDPTTYTCTPVGGQDSAPVRELTCVPRAG